MTGDEFKNLVEGFEPNSEINTIPELMHAMQGISDDTTVKQDVQDQIDEDMEGKSADSGDIDEIFNN